MDFIIILYFAILFGLPEWALERKVNFFCIAITIENGDIALNKPPW
jgi:hypothetical protein